MELSFSIYTPTKVYIRTNKHGCPCVYCNAYNIDTYTHTYVHIGTHTHKHTDTQQDTHLHG